MYVSDLHFLLFVCVLCSVINLNLAKFPQTQTNKGKPSTF